MANDDHDNAQTDKEMQQRLAHPELAHQFDTEAAHRRGRIEARTREIIIEELEKGLRELHIPDHMHTAIRCHVIDREPTGDFLTSLLENNLKESVMRADHMNLTALVDWCRLLYNYCPSGCWGSPAKVKTWLEGDDDASEADSERE